MEPLSLVPKKLSSIPTSISFPQVELDSSTNLKHKPAKKIQEIYVFHRLRNNCENPAKFIKALKCACHFDYKQEETD